MNKHLFFLFWILISIAPATSHAYLEYIVNTVNHTSDSAIEGDTAIAARAGENLVYVYTWDGTSWTNTASMTAHDLVSNENFGYRLALFDDVIVVTANRDNDVGPNSGSAYVFRKTGNQWLFEQKLVASDGAPYDGFGSSIAIDGDVIVVGSPGDDYGSNSGSAYVFRWNGNVWVEEAKLTGINGYTYFGHTVSTSNGVITIGTRQNENNIGAIHFFRWDGTSWNFESRETHTDLTDIEDMEMDGDVVVASGEDFDNAIVYRWDGSDWNLEEILAGSDTSPDDHFGSSVSIDGDKILIGASEKISTPYYDWYGYLTGASYVFEFDGSNWIQESKITPIPNYYYYYINFGRSVAIDSDKVFISQLYNHNYFYDISNLDFDGDGYTLEDGDCDEQDPNLNPGMTEICDEIDNDCDGDVDEGVTTTYYRDTDGDGFGHYSFRREACSLPTGYTTNNDDCNDYQASAYPGGTEVCDTYDNDCDGDVDENLTTTYFTDSDGDGFGDLNTPIETCSLPADAVTNSNDCDDSEANAFPGNPETCDEIDNNCNGQTDEGVTTTYYRDHDHDGFGTPDTSVQACAAPTGYANNDTDCDDSSYSINPSRTEVCDQRDNNCDGTVDEGFDSIWYRDQDRDGFGDPNVFIYRCYYRSGYTTDASDCDDTHWDESGDCPIETSDDPSDSDSGSGSGSGDTTDDETSRPFESGTGPIVPLEDSGSGCSLNIKAIKSQPKNHSATLFMIILLGMLSLRMKKNHF